MKGLVTHMMILFLLDRGIFGRISLHIEQSCIPFSIYFINACILETILMDITCTK
jgi:hypothetical protein